MVNTDTVPTDTLKQFLIAATYCVLEPVLIEHPRIKARDFIMINGAQLKSFTSGKMIFGISKSWSKSSSHCRV
jgi:hypothetical protein